MAKSGPGLRFRRFPVANQGFPVGFRKPETPGIRCHRLEIASRGLTGGGVSRESAGIRWRQRCGQVSGSM